jgi:hypothetical protein
MCIHQNLQNGAKLKSQKEYSFIWTTNKSRYIDWDMWVMSVPRLSLLMQVELNCGLKRTVGDNDADHQNSF